MTAYLFLLFFVIILFNDSIPADIPEAVQSFLGALSRAWGVKPSLAGLIE